MQIAKDSFGFENQGTNYGKFRPRYPQSLYNQTISSLTGKNKYLDIAMGTGQLLFNIAPEFNSSKGLDISDKMLEAARLQLRTERENLKDKIQIEKCDVLNISQNQTYDLITIGQALHWLPVREALKKIKGLLQPDGKLLVISYIVKGLEDESQNKIYQTFYQQTKQVKPDFSFNRDEMHNHYADQQEYPFSEFFTNVKVSAQDVKIPMPRSVYISYLKTYAGYNQMMSKYPQMQDPMIEVQKNTCGDTVTVIIDYFKVQCGN